MNDHKVKILLVEDDLMIVEMYKNRLEEEGFEVLTTDKGSKVLEIASKEKPDIILLDVILPEIDGFSVLEMLKNDSQTKNIPVMMLTNLGQEGDQNKGMNLGATQYFIKSQHTPSDVLVEIRKILFK